MYPGPLAEISWPFLGFTCSLVIGSCTSWLLIAFSISQRQ